MRALLMMMTVGGVFATGCSSSDACDGLATCLAVTAMSPGGTPLPIDQLVITVSGQVNGTRTVPTTPHPVTLPQTVALEFMPPGGYKGAFTFDVEIVGYKAGVTVANGTAHSTVTTGMHAAALVAMMPGPPMMTPVGDMALAAPSGDMVKIGD